MAEEVQVRNERGGDVVLQDGTRVKSKETKTVERTDAVESYIEEGDFTEIGGESSESSNEDGEGKEEKKPEDESPDGSDAEGFEAQLLELPYINEEHAAFLMTKYEDYEDFAEGVSAEELESDLEGIGDDYAKKIMEEV